MVVSHDLLINVQGKQEVILHFLSQSRNYQKRGLVNHHPKLHAFIPCFLRLSRAMKNKPQKVYVKVRASLFLWLC